MAVHSLIIGLTGNIATGKSTVLAYLAGKGAAILDADKLAHRAMAPDGPAYAAIVAEFGPTILRADGTVDRAALGSIVFADAHRLHRLEQIVHPAVFALTRQEVESTTSSLVILEAVKLLEAGAMATLCDEIWVVVAEPAMQLRRLMETRGMTQTDAELRMKMQSPQASKINQADRVIDNSGGLDALHAQLDAIWRDLARLYPKRMAALATA
jgi:dephospho-CoA kinase